MTYTTASGSSKVDGTPITIYTWQPPHQARAMVQISHGVAEHALRYDRLATALTAADYVVSAHDHRGHGTSISDQVALGGFGAAGWNGLVSDLVAIGNEIRTEKPDLPLFLLGHSMGSFALQEVILESDLGTAPGQHLGRCLTDARSAATDERNRVTHVVASLRRPGLRSSARRAEEHVPGGLRHCC